jgi:hypothetical protein
MWSSFDIVVTYFHKLEKCKVSTSQLSLLAHRRQENQKGSQEPVVAFGIF